MNTGQKETAVVHYGSCHNMFKFIVALLLWAQTYARPHEVEIDPHIVGGTPAAEGQYPFIVSLRKPDGLAFCGGALISNKYVLTAAHCAVNKTSLRIGAGSIYIAQQKLYEVDKIIIHPQYEFRRTENDIAILKLKTPIEIGGKVQTINFPVTENLDGKNVTALGWGRTSTDGPPSTTLLYLNRPIISNKECANRIFFPIIDSYICLGSEENYGMCFGDSGSPLLYKAPNGKNYVAGVVSWGIPCAVGFPDVFTRVSSFTDWIKQTIK